MKLVKNINQIDLSILFNKQKLLDIAIESKHKNELIPSITTKVLALIVELAEFANEGKEFKYWSIKKHLNSKEKMLEEYADCLHFILALAIKYNVDPIVDYREYGGIFKLQLLIDTLKDVCNLLDEKNITTKKITDVLSLIVALGFASGFTKDEIIETYIEKNEINFKRIRDGY